MKIFLRRLLRNIKYILVGFKCNDCINYDDLDGIYDIENCKGCKNLKNR